MVNVEEVDPGEEHSGETGQEEREGEAVHQHGSKAALAKQQRRPNNTTYCKYNCSNVKDLSVLSDGMLGKAPWHLDELVQSISTEQSVRDDHNNAQGKYFWAVCIHGEGLSEPCGESFASLLLSSPRQRRSQGASKYESQSTRTTAGKMPAET